MISKEPLKSDGAACRSLSDEALLDECRWEAFSGSGPGGQKRNKTSSSMRLTHLPTGIHVIAGESRSQAANKSRALWRLKLRLAIELRRTIDPNSWEPPHWLDEIRTRPAKNAPAGSRMRLQISDHNPMYHQLVGLILDLLDAQSGNVAQVAELLNFSTSSLVRFLESDPHLWAMANQIRAKSGHPPLTARR